jgi:hypothetical protein
MAGVPKEWVLIVVFLVTFLAFTFGESYWLQRRGRASFGKCLAAALLTNLLAITVGSFFSSLILLGLIAIAWGGTFESVFGSVAGLWSVVVIGLVIPFIILMIAKRFAIKILHISENVNPWINASEAAIGFFTATIGPRALVTFFL